MRAVGFVGAASLALLVVIPIARCAAFDGGWWTQMTEGEKLKYIAGFMDGADYELRVFDYALLLEQRDPKTLSWSPERARILIAAGKTATKQMNVDLGNVSAGQLVAGLDKLYADYRNARIATKDALTVVFRSMALSLEPLIDGSWQPKQSVRGDGSDTRPLLSPKSKPSRIPRATKATRIPLKPQL